jgi:hypothetical protein
VYREAPPERKKIRLAFWRRQCDCGRTIVQRPGGAVGDSLRPQFGAPEGRSREVFRLPGGARSAPADHLEAIYGPEADQFDAAGTQAMPSTPLVSRMGSSSFESLRFRTSIVPPWGQVR